MRGGLKIKDECGPSNSGSSCVVVSSADRGSVQVSDIKKTTSCYINLHLEPVGGARGGKGEGQGS